MKRILALFMIVLSIPVFSGSLPETVSEGLVLEARVDKTTFRVGEAIKIIVVMRNESELPIMVAANFGQEIADPTPDDWDLDSSSLPRDMLWKDVWYVTPFGTRYRQDHPFPRTLNLTEWNAPIRGKYFDENDFWHRNLMALMPGMEVGFAITYVVSELPESHSSGSYEIQYRYAWPKEVIQRQRKFLSRLVSSTTLDPVPMSLSFDGSESEHAALPHFCGTAFSNTLHLKVAKGNAHE